MSVAARIGSHVVAAAAGATAAYYLDPDRGRSRRTRSRDRGLARGRRATRDLEKRARYFEGKLEGAQARARGRGVLHPEDDHLVKQGVEQRLSAAGVDDTDVVIDVTDGVVGLRGQVNSADDLRRIEVETAQVPGVEEVHSWLHLPGEVAPNKALAMRANPST